MPIGQNRLIVFSFFLLGGCPYTMVTVKTTSKGTQTGHQFSSLKSWSVGSCENEDVIDDGKTVSQTCCLEKGFNLIVCKEAEGRGWMGGYLEINGQKFCDNWWRGFSKEEYVNI